VIAAEQVADPSVIGVGIDLEDRGALARFRHGVLRRAARRWLSPEEREWCASQSEFAEAVLVVLCCKEAVFKTGIPTSMGDRVSLALAGSCARGAGQVRYPAAVVRVEWWAWRDQVVALALARSGAHTLW
jgi:phosphopantetheinyl transferase (holo-ACP synthase)